MSKTPQLKPTHKSIRGYYNALAEFANANVGHEMAVRSAFQTLLAETARSRGWLLVPEEVVRVKGREVRPDGTLRDQYNLHRGYWEAKDTSDRLEIEIGKKIKSGYPLTNIIFEDTREARLYQNGEEALRADLSVAQDVADLFNAFFAYTEPDIAEFEHAVEEFKERVPDLAGALAKIIAESHKTNRKFQEAFDAFFTICHTALNPNISQAAVDEMLVQHLLTERLIRKLFDPHFTQRNVIAVEVEKVIAALTSRSFNRDEFLRSLDKFYRAIEHAGEHLADFTEKQHFLNTIYERFFQGYSVKLADTHGIVYTPQPIVDFMCASVAEVLQTEFGKSLGDPGVNILDPCTGTGNFIVNLMRRISKRNLPRMYRQQLFANEVMLLPYYIAALNIEHAYYELTGEYEPFEGLCFVDTLDLVEKEQKTFGFMTEENTQRVERQRKAPITVIIGNPPYNMGQVNENDNNRNRKYDYVDRRIGETFARSSKATLKNKLYDPYVRFFRWAIDRLETRDGVVCFITNNSFVDQLAFDGFRKHFLDDFSKVYHLDLHGNVRENPKLSGTTHNVFGIQVGVGITLAVRKESQRARTVNYHRVAEIWRRQVKLQWLADQRDVVSVKWQTLTPDSRNSWIVPQNADEFARGLVLGLKPGSDDEHSLFGMQSLGVVTSRDEWAYDFSTACLNAKMRKHVSNYNAEVMRYLQEDPRPSDVGGFVNNDPRVLKWTDRLKDSLEAGHTISFTPSKIRRAMYRPYVERRLYFDHLLNQRRYQQHYIFPAAETERENRVIWVKVGSEWPMFCLAVNCLVDLLPQGGSQCFPFYVYDDDGSNRRENITDWALEQFRRRYANVAGTLRVPTASPKKRPKNKTSRAPHTESAVCNGSEITKWDIFYYVYGLLHHPGYRERYAENLKRDLPRIPFAPDFWTFSRAGKELTELHLNYEQLEPWALEWLETPGEPLSYRVEKMKLDKDKKALRVNESLTLAGIPPEVFEYRLGNRSALDWVIDQYQVNTDKRSGITSDPNRADDPEYIVRLVGQAVRVSMETVRIVRALPAEFR